jgi:hypothetical protein
MFQKILQNSSFYSCTGLVLDVIGFIIIYKAVIKTEIKDAFGVLQYPNYEPNEPLAKKGFYLVILGFMFQFLASLYSLIVTLAQ